MKFLPFHSWAFVVINIKTVICFNRWRHDVILYGIGEYSNINLINIDHHDDIMHGAVEDDYVNEEEVNDLVKNCLPLSPHLFEEYSRLKEDNEVNEGNWIAWLHSQGKLNSIVWIHNPNSINLQRNDFNIQLLGDKYTFHLREDYKFEESIFADYDFDHVFVCLSPTYIPASYWHYMTMFMMTYESFTGKKANMISKKFEYYMRYNEITKHLLPPSSYSAFTDM